MHLKLLSLLVFGSLTSHLYSKPITFVISNQTHETIAFSAGWLEPITVQYGATAEFALDDNEFNRRADTHIIFGKKGSYAGYSVFAEKEFLQFDSLSKYAPSCVIRDYAQKDRLSITILPGGQVLGTSYVLPYRMNIEGAEVINRPDPTIPNLQPVYFGWRNALGITTLGLSAILLGLFIYANFHS